MTVFTSFISSWGTVIRELLFNELLLHSFPIKPLLFPFAEVRNDNFHGFHFLLGTVARELLFNELQQRSLPTKLWLSSVA